MALAICLAISQLAKPWLRSQVFEREQNESFNEQQEWLNALANWVEFEAEEGEAKGGAASLPRAVEAFVLPQLVTIEVISPAGEHLVHGKSQLTREELALGRYSGQSDDRESGRSFEDIASLTYFSGYFWNADEAAPYLFTWQKNPSGYGFAALQDLGVLEASVAGSYSLISATAVGASVLVGICVFVIVTYQSRRYQRRIDETLEELAKALAANIEQNHQLEAQSKRLRELIGEIHDLNRILVHDLKAPIANIQSLTRFVLEDESELSETKQSYLHLIESSCDHATSLIGGILEVSELEKEEGRLELRELELNALVQGIADNHRQAAKMKNISIMLSPVGSGVRLKSEEKWLTSLLANLVSNAVKYTHRGGAVTITTTMDGDQPAVKIEDQGPGFSEDDQRKMFRKFQRLSARPTGEESSHGLGLYTVKLLADRLGAVVDFSTSVGVGSTFLVRLPSGS